MASPERSSQRASSEGRKIGSKKKLSRKRAKSETEIKDERPESAVPATTVGASAPVPSGEAAGMERKSSSKKRRSFFKRSRSSSTGRNQSKDRGEADVGPPDATPEPQATSTDVASPREVLSDDEEGAQSKPRDRFRRMTVKEAMMQKKVKRVSSSNTLSSSRRRRAEAEEENYGQDYDDYEAEVASIRTLSASSPDLHRDERSEFVARGPSAAAPAAPPSGDHDRGVKSSTKATNSSATKSLKADKVQKMIKSTSPTRAKSNKSSKSIDTEEERPERVSRKGEEVCYIKVSKDVKQTGKKSSPSPHRKHHHSSPSRHSSRSRSPGSRSRKESRERAKYSSGRSKSPRRGASRSPKVSRSLSAKHEPKKSSQRKDRRTKSMEKDHGRSKRVESGRTQPTHRNERRYVRDDDADEDDDDEDEEMVVESEKEMYPSRHPEEFQDDDDMDADDDESHTLFMELSKTLSPYSLSPAGQEQDLQAVNKYNSLRRSTSNLLLAGKAENDSSKMDNLAVAGDARPKSASPRVRSPVSSDTDPRYSRLSSGAGARRESSDAHWRRDDDSMSPTSPTWPVFDDYSGETSPTSPTFPLSPSNKYTRTFSPTRNRTKDKKSSSSSRTSYESQPERASAATDGEAVETTSRPSSRYLSGSGITKGSLEQDVPCRTDTSPTSTSPLSASPTGKFGPTPTITLSKPAVIGVKSTFPGAGLPSSDRKPISSSTSKSTVPSASFKSVAKSVIPSNSTKSSHSVPIPTVSVPEDYSAADPPSRSGSIKPSAAKGGLETDKLTINIPRSSTGSQVDEDSLSPPSRSSRSKTPTRTPSLKAHPKSPTKSVSPGHKSSSTSTDGSGSAKYSHPSTSRSPSPRSSSIVDSIAGSSPWSASPTKKGETEPAMFFPEVDIVKETPAEPEVREKKAKKVQRSFSERDASKRPMPRISEILVKTDSMRKITRISAEDVNKLKEMADNQDKPLNRKGEKLTSSESALEKSGEKNSLLDSEETKKDKDKKEKKKTEKRWSLKGRSRKDAVEKKKEKEKEKEEKKKSKKEKEKDKKTSKKVKKSDSSVSKKEEEDMAPSVHTQTVLLGNHLSGITLDVEADFDPDLEDYEKYKDHTNHSSWPAIVMLKHRLACQRRLRTGMDIDNDDELRELNLLNQLVRQPLDAPIPLENEANLLKSLDIRETALIGDSQGQSGLPHKLDQTKSQSSLEDDPEFIAKRAQMRRESKVFRMIERRRKILSCIKKFIAFLFSHIGLCSLVVAYSIMGGFVFKALEGPYEQKNVVNVTALRMATISKISQLSVEFNMTKLSRWNFTEQVNNVLVTFQQNVHNATKNDVYYTSSNDEELDIKWSYASSLLYAITVMTTIGYGHVAPKTVHGRIVTIIYAVLGIPLTLLCLTNIGNLMADGFRILYGKVCCGLCCLLFKPRRRRIHDPELGGVMAMERKVEKSNEVVKVPTSLCILLIASYIFAGALLFSLWEDWDYLTGSYFCFITLSTIGFGDIVPGTDIKSWSQQEKLVLCALYLVIGLSLIAMCFNLVQEDVKAKCIWLGRKFGIIDKDDSGMN